MIPRYLLSAALICLAGIVLVQYNSKVVAVRSVIVQVLVYYSRPHQYFGEIPMKPIVSRAAWKGSDFTNQEQEWKYWLTDVQVEDVLKAVDGFSRLNISLKHMKREMFPLPSWSDRIVEWKRELNPKYGTGVVVIKNVPIKHWNKEQNEIFWWGLGKHLGTPGAQNGKGDLLGHVKNEFYDGNKTHGSVRQYRTTEAIGFHCDTADVVGLYCIKAAMGRGEGISRVASSVAIYNELLRTSPDLVPLLYKNIPFDSRGESGINWFPLRPARYWNGVLRTFWHTEYMKSAYQYPDSISSSISPEVSRLITAYDSIANRPEFFMEMEFEEGDVQLLSNHVVVHGRTGFVDNDPTGKTGRHVLRLWLSLDGESHNANGGGLPDMDTILERSSAIASGVEFITTLVWIKLRGMFL